MTALKCVFIDAGNGYYSYWHISELLAYAPYCGEFIQMLWGDMPYYLFEILGPTLCRSTSCWRYSTSSPCRRWMATTCSTTWCSSARCLPRRRAARIGYVVLIVLLFSGVTGDIISFVADKAFWALGSGAGALLGALGVF